MSATPDSTSTDPEQGIADLERQLAERTAERDEALRRETATAEVLQVINSSPGDLKPVFDVILERAMHLCGASFGIFRITYDGALFHTVAAHGVPAAYGEFLFHNPQLPAAGTSGARMLGGDPVVHIVDLAEAAHYRAGEAHVRALVELGGARTALTVPRPKRHQFSAPFRVIAKRFVCSPTTNLAVAELRYADGHRWRTPSFWVNCASAPTS
jgi:hypothetical protein